MNAVGLDSFPAKIDNVSGGALVGRFVPQLGACVPKETMCNCKEQPILIDISNNYSDFKSKLNQLEVGNWVLLMQCPDCNQFYKVDEWDKYQTCYAVKIPSSENWESFDSESIIKEQMVQIGRAHV